jgi:uncharacterized protein YndB with AHSA1/START domain
MPTDLSRHLGAVARTVDNRTHEGRPARVVIASRWYDTTVEDLWDALTNKERIPRWFLPVSGDLRLGGRYQLQGNAGGTITRCEPPHRVAMTWEYGGQMSWVDVKLEQTADGRAHLELEHIAHVPDEQWDQFGPGAVGVGWDMALAGLGTHIATRESVDPAEAMAWLGSEDGKTFVRQSSDDWCQASIASGTDETSAAAAAARTTAAYTGEGTDAPAEHGTG